MNIIAVLGLICIFITALQAKCRENWQEYDGQCYKVFQDRMTTWPESENNCQVWGDDVHLASIHSEKEMGFLFDLINDSQMHLPHEDHFHHKISQSDSLWIGMTLFCPEDKPGKWTDGTKLDYYSLLKQRVNDEHMGSCVAYRISKLNPQWVVRGCGALYPYVCKSPLNESFQIPYDESRSLCGDWKWCRYKEKCYKIDTTPKIWLDAETSCQNFGADLLSIHSENELNYILENFLKNWDNDDTFWTGLNKYESMDERFRWSDGTPLNYAPKTKIEYKEWRTASCFLLDPANGPMWKLDRCDEKHMSLCSKPAENFTASANLEPVTRNIDGFCRTGWMKYCLLTDGYRKFQYLPFADNKCYKVYGLSNSSRKENFFGAQNTCYMENAHLVSIKDFFENFFILSLLNGAKNSWIGLIQNSGSIKWLDETKLGFVNFDTNSLTLNSMIGDRNTDQFAKRCFYMSIQKWPGFWEPVRTLSTFSDLVGKSRKKSSAMLGERSKFRQSLLTADRQRRFTSYINWRQHLTNEKLCESEKMSFVCEQAVSSKSKINESNDLNDENPCRNLTPSSINGKFFSFSNNCYEFISDRRTWPDAQSLCSENNSTFNFTNLVSVSNLQEFAFITSIAKTIVGFEKFWIGLNDNETSGTFKWSDHWPETFVRWGRGEPKRSKIESCVRMTLDDDRGADWALESCEMPLYFVCKMSNDPPSESDVKNGTCPPKWFAGSSQCYKIISDDWTSGSNAVLKCWREHNATLASFIVKEDIDRLIKRAEIVYAKRRFFIGLMQKLHGQYEWLTNEPLTFINWAPGEPRFAWNSNVEVCVEMDDNGLWYDVGCYETRHYICSMPKKSVEESLEDAQINSSITSTSTTTTYSNTNITPSRPTTAPSTSTALINESSTNYTLLKHKSVSSSLKKIISKKSSQQAASGWSIFGLILCVLFVSSCVLFLAYFLYNRRLSWRHCVFNTPTDDPSSMRFEILNETDEI